MNKLNVLYARKAVILNMTGVLLSGLFFPILAMWLYPQPVWKDAALFSHSFHPVQTLTYFAGFFLITGSLLTFSALTFLAPKEKRIHAIAALAVHILFAAIVFINYVIQTTYVPYLATTYPAEAESLLPALSMGNSGSLAWALEMYGWGGIGLSFVLMTPVFEKSATGKSLKYLFLLNGCCSIITALVTSVNMKWIFSGYGLFSLVSWNLLVLVIDMLLLKYFRSKFIFDEPNKK